MRFKADGTGKVAIYQPVTGNEDAPFNNPVANIDNVVWHSDFITRPISRVVNIDKVLTLPNSTVASAAIEIFTHGLGYAPYIDGHLVDFPQSGQKTPWVGTLPVDFSADGTAAPAYIPRTVTLLWDKTKIYAVFCVWYASTGDGRRTPYRLKAQLRIGNWEVENV